MSVRIILDEVLTPFTSLDTISGKIVVNTPRSISVGTVNVKLEGESRTRLVAARTLREEEPRPQLEYHRVLYRVATVFPPPELRDRVDGRANFTLPAGQHEYPFSFKLPFNASCAIDEPTTSTFSLPGVNLAKVSLSPGDLGGISHTMVRVPEKHVRGSLPPTLRGFPGEAEIRYFIKATVARPGLFRENIRQYVNFAFCPIEPPRKPDNGEESFARRKHQFQEPPGSRSTHFTQKLAQVMPSEKKSASSASAPLISIETRLPEPAILTLHQPLPLKVFVTTLNEKIEGLVLQSIQLELAHYTRIRAFELSRTEQGSTVMLSVSNLSIPLQFDAQTSEADIPTSLWQNIPVPDTLPPTFECCNIGRNYELIVRIGIRWDCSKESPQYAHTELHNPVQLYSGIAPSEELLSTLTNRNRRSSARKTSMQPEIPHRTRPSASDASQPPPLPERPPDHKSKQSSSVPGAWPTKPATLPAQGTESHSPAYQEPANLTPVDAAGGTSFPGTTGLSPNATGGLAPGAEIYSDAPPSYEDAVADSLPPVQGGGTRRGYNPPPATGEDMLLPSGEKNRG